MDEIAVPGGIAEALTPALSRRTGEEIDRGARRTQGDSFLAK